MHGAKGVAFIPQSTLPQSTQLLEAALEAMHVSNSCLPNRQACVAACQAQSSTHTHMGRRAEWRQHSARLGQLMSQSEAQPMPHREG